jgi:hypothetical protein
MNLVDAYAGKHCAVSKYDVVSEYGIRLLTKGKMYRVLYHAPNTSGDSAIILIDDAGRQSGWSAERFYIYSSVRLL